MADFPVDDRGGRVANRAATVLAASPPKPTPFVSYYRVSTERQGRSGLGLEAQRETTSRYIVGILGGTLAAEFIEVESGRRSDRPQLALALEDAKRRRATLLIAKLDRLARNTRFLLTIIESGVDVVFCDLPSVPPGPVGKFLITQMAAVAELEAGLTSQRTKAALAAAKAKGKRLGNPRLPEAAALGAAAKIKAADTFAVGPAPLMKQLKAQGMSLRGIARELNERKVETAQGRTWHAETVKAVLARTAPRPAPSGPERGDAALIGRTSTSPSA